MESLTVPDTVLQEDNKSIVDSADDRDLTHKRKVTLLILFVGFGFIILNVLHNAQQKPTILTITDKE
eukprot:14464059-Ditylum_brightwellii.AAC.1